VLCRPCVFLNKWKWSEIKINDEVNYKTHNESFELREFTYLFLEWKNK